MLLNNSDSILYYFHYKFALIMQCMTKICGNLELLRTRKSQTPEHSSWHSAFVGTEFCCLADKQKRSHWKMPYELSIVSLSKACSSRLGSSILLFLQWYCDDSEEGSYLVISALSRDKTRLTWQAWKWKLLLTICLCLHRCG